MTDWQHILPWLQARVSRVPVSEGKVAPHPPSSHPLQPHPPPPHDTRTSVNTNQLAVYLTTFLYAQIILCFTKRDVYRTFGTFYLPFSFSPLPYFLSFPFSSPSSPLPPITLHKMLSRQDVRLRPPFVKLSPVRLPPVVSQSEERTRGALAPPTWHQAPHTLVCVCVHTLTVMFSTAL